MPFSPNARPPDTLCEALACPAEAVTATDLIVSPPAYLQELHDALGRAERAYAGGDPAEAVRLAEEGLAVVRLAEAKLGAASVPSHYRAFFHCLHIAPAYRAALAHFKRGLLCRQLAGSETEDAFRRAWQIFGPAVAGLEEDLTIERLTYDYPVTGRVLRGAVRLREQLRAHLRLIGAAQPAGRQILMLHTSPSTQDLHQESLRDAVDSRDGLDLHELPVGVGRGQLKHGETRILGLGGKPHRPSFFVTG